ncbi:NAD(P)H-dependent oxidoreductase [Streptomyces sp. AM8-1-1]|uniref:NAD(P)H-dependent oxidoreductase n=1 Tax=Streptomyces sp. AM8-1-1 TaxID=3075825 RepID=UPI0028C3D0B8|nr:NAD(P)H-dependent oxidoreductase [Streptomyces sp. AM8-1-1]WNO72427.1 NAD(P)H-dependent oxidoreductase [Streptomyces sp. AM8-1-1]
MRVLWVSAHPDPRSLNGALRDEGVAVLRERGHEVVESDLYVMGWNPVVDHGDFAHDPDKRLDVLTESQRALETGTLSEDIRQEQAKLLWADTLVVQFPLWWFGMPAILKGWFDRLFVQGFAQGVPDPATGRAMRYGDGGLSGRRALVVTTVGANAATTGPRGIHGDINDVLFPILHGTLWYTGMSVVPPLVVNGTVCLSGPEYEAAAERLRERLVALPDTDPIPYRRQSGGDYDEHLVLRPEHARGEEGIRIHYTGPGQTEPCETTGGPTEADR